MSYRRVCNRCGCRKRRMSYHNLYGPPNEENCAPVVAVLCGPCWDKEMQTRLILATMQGAHPTAIPVEVVEEHEYHCAVHYDGLCSCFSATG